MAKTYTVKRSLQHDGERYAPGEGIDLEEKAAARLLKSGAIEAPPAPPQPRARKAE